MHSLELAKRHEPAVGDDSVALLIDSVFKRAVRPTNFSKDLLLDALALRLAHSTLQRIAPDGEQSRAAITISAPHQLGEMTEGPPLQAGKFAVDLQDAVVCKQQAMDAAALRAAADVAERTVLEAFC